MSWVRSVLGPKCLDTGSLLPDAEVSSLVPNFFRNSAYMSGQFGTVAEVSVHFGTSAEMFWVRR